MSYSGNQCRMSRSMKQKVSEHHSGNMMKDDLVEEELIESDIELDNSDVVDPDFDPPQEMGDPSVKVTEQNRKAAQELQLKAMDAILEGEIEEAVGRVTEAIKLNPKSHNLYASRASIFVKLKKPNAAIQDADAALQINADSAKGYKARGMAKALLGIWEEAAKDLRTAFTLYFDEETGGILRKVESNVKKIVEHRKKYELLRMEIKMRKIRIETLRQLQEAEFTDGQIILIQSASDLRTKLDAASNTSRLAVLYFTARWCGPCYLIGPVCSTFAEKYPKAAFLKVDIDDARDAAAEWRIDSIPSFYLCKYGKIVDKEVEINMTSLEKKITQHYR